jgi:hypothetical protein
MCFSATASFSLAATTAAVGFLTLRHVRRPKEFLLAAVPLLFAFQQAVEGALWLQFSGEGGGASIAALSLVFLSFAKVLWPGYGALAVLLIEPDRRRRSILGAIATIGFVLSAYLLADLVREPPAVFIRDHSIAYSSDVNPLSWWQMPYLLCTCAPLFISSHRTIQVFGAVILLGFAVSAYAYLATFISVWCFFAAGGSALLYFHFRHAAFSATARHP